MVQRGRVKLPDVEIVPTVTVLCRGAGSSDAEAVAWIRSMGRNTAEGLVPHTSDPHMDLAQDTCECYFVNDLAL
jgi:hypothetical protein